MTANICTPSPTLPKQSNRLYSARGTRIYVMKPIAFLQALILGSEKRQAVLEKATSSLKHCLKISNRLLFELYI